jgi:VanZ family protein
VIVWAAITFFLSTLSSHQIEEIIPFKFWDKLGHFLLFSTGGALMATALRLTTDWSWGRIVVVSTVLVSIYGATDEWHQQFTPGRSAKDVGDWTADTMGGVFGSVFAFVVISKVRFLRVWLRLERTCGSERTSVGAGLAE